METLELAKTLTDSKIADKTVRNYLQYKVRMGASIYHVVRGGGRGVHEMTMNDHEGEGEGFRNDHVVRWTEIFYFRSENGCMNSFFI